MISLVNENDCYWTYFEDKIKKVYIYTEQIDVNITNIKPIASYYDSKQAKSKKKNLIALGYKMNFKSEEFNLCKKMLGLTGKHHDKKRSSK